MTQSKTEKIKVISNKLIALNTYKMVFEKQINAKPGQFINIKLDNHYLRRPISISIINEQNFEIIYKIKGQGTKDLSNIKENEYLDILYPLGNGFELVENKNILLIGGGVGIPPLLELYKQLKNNNEVKLLIGITNLAENAYTEYNPLIATIEKSVEFQGNIIQYLKANPQIKYDYIYSCGPMPMLQAIQEYVKVDGQISIEERMGCGFGACMGCSCKTKDNSYKRICVEGPVFKIGELNLNDY
ncbi:dihydroorotate dehydrogenase electron transfer subunit [Mycoplasma sp. P36-A1]|uniref:dihydroorotate dehydrogenase electron transfer subunit n=1 Tax=Mycoplasma sp. P36-A1 TaxID=3252900 RepID=UPI003C2C8896